MTALQQGCSLQFAHEAYDGIKRMYEKLNLTVDLMNRLNS